MSLILSGTDGLSDVDGSASTPAIRGTDANTGIFFPAADTIAFAEGGVESMRIDSSGNVGIGTASPLVKFDVNGSASLTAATTETRLLKIGQGRTGSGFAGVDFIGDATNTDYAFRILRGNGGVNAPTSMIQRGTGSLDLTCEGAASIRFSTSNAERMLINSSGKILASAGTNWAGTVSQSGSSSVIESGSNANGHFTKFADGTQICRVAVGYNAASVTWAAAFVNTDYHTVATNDTVSVVGTTVLGRTTTGISFLTNATANSINFIAIGRWY
jgi:hypothetical protein